MQTPPPLSVKWSQRFDHVKLVVPDEVLVAELHKRPGRAAEDLEADELVLTRTDGTPSRVTLFAPVAVAVAGEVFDVELHAASQRTKTLTLKKAAPGSTPWPRLTAGAGDGAAAGVRVATDWDAYAEDEDEDESIARLGQRFEDDFDLDDRDADEGDADEGDEDPDADEGDEDEDEDEDEGEDEDPDPDSDEDPDADEDGEQDENGEEDDDGGDGEDVA
jgi:hypothetical protein